LKGIHIDLKTLFVSDLDGTLLGKNATLSEYSIKIINLLIDSGMNFTIATARSPWSLQIIENLNITIPAVMLNGVCVYDIRATVFDKTEELGKDIITELLPIIHQLDLSGFLYMVKDNHLNVYYENVTAPHVIAFMKERIEKFGKTFTRAYPFTDYNFTGMIPAYYTVCERLEILSPFYERIKHIKGLRAEFYRDVYNKDLWFLELLSERASKYNAVNYLKEKYAFERVVAFGDNLNDLPLFAASDYCLAVENAHDEVKSKANEIIKSNTEDGVAEWLSENYKRFL